MEVSAITPSLIKSGTLIRSRLKKATVYTFATFAGTIVATRGNTSAEVLVLAPLSTLVIFLGIYLLNDMFDLEVDKINAPTRPLATNTVTREQTLLLILLLDVLGLTISFLFLGIFALIVAVFEILLGILYSVRPFNFKDRFIVKTMTIGAGGVLSNLFGGVASGVVNSDLLFCSAMFLVYVFATSPLNDLADYTGDKAQHRKTIPIVIGPDKTIKLSVLTSLVPPIMSLLFYETLNFNFLAVGILSLIAAWSLRLLSPLWSSKEVNYSAVRKSQKRMVYLHFLLQGAFIIGSLAL